MTPQQILRTLFCHRRTILSIIVLTVLSALALSLLMPKKYVASSAVVIDVKSPDPVAGMVLPALTTPGYMATQVDVINSERVAERVVKNLHLEENQEFRQRWQDATEGKGDFLVWMANQLQEKLEVKPARESNVINIGFKDTDPRFAAAVANAFAQAYIDINLELKVEPARQNATWFEDQKQQARVRLEVAQSAYSAYQEKSGVVATKEELDHETAKLNELSAKLTEVQGETSDSHSKNRSASRGATLPEVMQNPVVISLKTDIARLESKLKENSTNLGKNHPLIQQSESELASLRGRLESETRKILNSIETSYQVGRMKENELRDAIEKQKAHLLGLNKKRDEISVLRRDLESAQRAFDDVSQRASQARLESVSVLTNVVVLSSASEPAKPSSPKIKLNLLVAVLFGSMLGAGYALLQEFMHRRVRSIDDLSMATEIPVLASIPHVEVSQRTQPERQGWRRWLPLPRKPIVMESIPS